MASLQDRRRVPTAVLLLRALRRACPRCGSRHVFSHWFRMAERCPRCDYLFAREDGFFLGAFVINFAVTEGALGIVLGVMIALEAGGGVAIGLIVAAAIAVTLVVPIVFYPFSKTVWTAIDLFMHPDLQAYDPARRPAPRSGPPG
jgi:uncharacterized protein (DUF983 family)